MFQMNMDKLHEQTLNTLESQRFIPKITKKKNVIPMVVKRGDDYEAGECDLAEYFNMEVPKLPFVIVNAVVKGEIAFVEEVESLSSSFRLKPPEAPQFLELPIKSTQPDITETKSPKAKKRKKRLSRVKSESVS